MLPAGFSSRFKALRPAVAMMLALAGLAGASDTLAQTQPAPQVQQKAAPAQQPAQAPAPGATQHAPAPGAAAPQGTDAPPAPVEQAPAEPPPPPPVLSAAERRELEEITRPLVEIKSNLERLEKAVERNKTNDEELARLRDELIEVFRSAAAARESLKPRSEALAQQIEKLGPAPEKDATESSEVATERARLNAMASEIDGALKNTELLFVRARQLRVTLQTARQELFANQLFRRTLSPIAPTIWGKLIQDAPGASRQIGDTLSSWLTLAKRKWIELAGLVGGVILLFVLLRTLVHWFLAYRLDRPRSELPSFFVRAATIGWVAPLMALPALAALQGLGIGLDWFKLLTWEIGQIAEKAYPALYVFIGVAALTRAILQPRRAAWRLVDLSTPAARALTRIITLIAAVFAADIILQEAIRRLFLPFSINILETALASIAIGVLMLKLVGTRFEPKSVTTGLPNRDQHDGAIAGTTTSSRLKPYLIKLPVLAVALVILAASLLGYVGLGRFLTQQVIFTGSAIAVILVFHLAIRALLGAPGTGIKPFATVLQEKVGLDESQSGLLSRALSVLLNAGLALAALPLILITWGYSYQEALYWMRAAVFGFQIGDFRISLARILIAAVLFFALVFATRLAQRWIDRGVARSKRIDQGIANSIHTAVGYTGFIVAALAAISYGGLDITNFAIVAGALSVGIGFGLQSIINNFVSGLILLVERPIKVGDRVMVKDREGFVRRISVRSTEIETGDKASLIVPNSDLITSAVTNWTHRNALGTVTVKVRVSYQSDAERVRDILQKVGAECSLVLQHPAPSVTFDNFGADGLEFSLGAVVPDVTKAGAVQSELRFAILKAFRQAGIEMPYAQHDIHLRDLDLVRGLLTRLAEERARAASVSATKPGATRNPNDKG